MQITKKVYIKGFIVLAVVIFGILGSIIRFDFFDMQEIPFLTAAYIAHRGAYTQQIPENSLAAFQNAIDKGISIELDVTKTQDGYPIIFHDDRLERLTNGRGKVKTVDLADIEQLALKNSNEKIPTLEETLKLVDGKVALLIEIKNNGLPGQLEQRVLKDLQNYHGDVAIQSFNPLVIRWFRKKTSAYNAGLILGEAHIKKLRLLRDNIYSFIAAPNFLVYRYDIFRTDKTLYTIQKKGLLVIPYTLSIKNLDELNWLNLDTAIIHLEE